MFTLRARIISAFVLTVALATASFGQQSSSPTPRPSEPSQDGQQSQPAPRAEAPPARSENYVETKGFKGKVFEIKYRDPAAVADRLD